MGKRGVVLAALAAALGLGTSAQAAGTGAHRYVLLAAAPAQAAVVDLAGATRVGQMVTVPIVLLRRQPARLSQGDIYWADGLEQVDCDGHRVRLMLMAGLTLDRAHRFDEPNPAFRAWDTPAPGSNGRRLEDAVCGGGAGDGGLAPVASLGALER